MNKIIMKENKENIKIDYKTWLDGKLKPKVINNYLGIFNDDNESLLFLLNDVYLDKMTLNEFKSKIFDNLKKRDNVKKPEKTTDNYISYFKKLLEFLKEYKNKTIQYDTDITGSSYSKKEFLNEVYMKEEDFNRLFNLLQRRKNIILEGPPGVGKTFIAKKLAYTIMGEQRDDKIEMIQFHQSYSYEDFIMGYRPKKEGGFKLKKGIFYNFCNKASNHKNEKYFFIIDEINRGNLSKIFGELFMLIEEDKRGTELPLLYAGDEVEKISVPENLYIIGLMNTADRSLAMMDYALRRRFAFFPLKPVFDNEKFEDYIEKINSSKIRKIVEIIKEINKVITEDESLGEGFLIGHSFFCNLNKNQKGIDIEIILRDIIDYEIIPLLKEYWFENAKIFNDYRTKLEGVF